MTRPPPDPRPWCRHQMIKRWPWVTAWSPAAGRQRPTGARPDASRFPGSRPAAGPAGSRAGTRCRRALRGRRGRVFWPAHPPGQPGADAINTAPAPAPLSPPRSSPRAAITIYGWSTGRTTRRSRGPLTNTGRVTSKHNIHSKDYIKHQFGKLQVARQRLLHKFARNNLLLRMSSFRGIRTAVRPH